jgi:ribosome-associated protein
VRFFSFLIKKIIERKIELKLTFMNTSRFNELYKEFDFSATRSQGPGGQHVNKVNTRVELRFHIRNSEVLNELEKQKLERYVKSRITKEGELIITAQETRSQIKNKEEAVKRFFQLLNEALAPRKNRKPTRPTRSSVQKRLENKRRIAAKKKLRNKNLNID